MSVSRMRSRDAMRRQVETAWAGWPIPEMIGGAIVGALLLLSVVTIVPQLAAIVPNVVGLAAGAIIGAILSYVWRPRRIALEREGRMRPEDQHIRRAA